MSQDGANQLIALLEDLDQKSSKRPPESSCISIAKRYKQIMLDALASIEFNVDGFRKYCLESQDLWARCGVLLPQQQAMVLALVVALAKPAKFTQASRHWARLVERTFCIVNHLFDMLNMGATDFDRRQIALWDYPSWSNLVSAYCNMMGTCDAREHSISHCRVLRRRARLCRHNWIGRGKMMRKVDSSEANSPSIINAGDGGKGRETGRRSDIFSAI
ncbi:hypothetical protein B0H17DRAFT_1141647 [Mycena rosella]|uniref:Uncharacterized protein n=1 Tax=Mycena rosella TaxID=1033263 RepID=A0AAD7G6G5_MYCRO|nr:hypothetical protein B0H17DRAFT_1141647 [Mycena rosella]